MSKIGIGVTSWKRPDIFKLLLKELERLDDRFYFAFVFDGPIDPDYDLDGLEEQFGCRYETCMFIDNRGVAAAKNQCITLLNEWDVDYIFLMDDDLSILDNSVFDHYINISARSGIQHLTFSHVGGNTRTYTLMLSDTQGLTTHTHAQGAFMFFTKAHLEAVGKFDEGFVNALEHVDMTYRSYNIQGLPFWFFIDALDSHKFLKERECTSTITEVGQYRDNILTSHRRWGEKHGKNVVDIPRVPITELIAALKTRMS